MRGDFDLDRIAALFATRITSRGPAGGSTCAHAGRATRTSPRNRQQDRPVYDLRRGDATTGAIRRCDPFAFRVCTRRAPCQLGSHEPRVALAGEVMLPGDIPLLFISTHLNSLPRARVAGGSSQRYSAAQALAILAGTPAYRKARRWRARASGRSPAAQPAHFSRAGTAHQDRLHLRPRTSGPSGKRGSFKTTSPRITVRIWRCWAGCAVAGLIARNFPARSYEYRVKPPHPVAGPNAWITSCVPHRLECKIPARKIRALQRLR